MQTINGQEYQHATMSLSVAGIASVFTFDKFSKVSYKDGADKKPVMNHQGQIIGYTIDNQRTEGSFSTLRSEWYRFKQWIVQQYAAFGLGIGQIEMVASLTYGNTLASLKTDSFSFMVNEDAMTSDGSNQDAHSVDVPLFVWNVLMDGMPFINYKAI